MSDPSESVDFLAILGSATPPGRLHRAIHSGIESAGLDAAGLVDLAELEIPPASGRPAAEASDLATLLERIERADVVLLASPVYRGSITGVLKNLLDHVPVSGLRGTIVPTVTMGATDHHYLGADRHFRDILTFFGAATLPTSLYLKSADFETGRPLPATIESVTHVVESSIGFSHALQPLSAWGTPPLHS